MVEINAPISSKVDETLDKQKASHIKKFLELEKGQKQQIKSRCNSNIINLSRHTLNQDEMNVLKKGLNFAIAPKNISMERIVCTIENAISVLPVADVEEVRQECVRI